MVDPDMQALVYDNGSDMMKIGFSGDDAPRAVFPTIVGRPKFPGIMVGMDAKDCFVGDEAQAKRGILRLYKPLQRGKIRNWIDMEKVYHHSPYNELCVTPEEHPLLLTEHPSNPNENRNKLTQMHFEVFNVPALAYANPGVLSLYAAGITTGLGIDIGSITSISPVYEGHLIHHALQKTNIGGEDITKYMEKILQKNIRFVPTNTNHTEIVRDIKEKTGYVALDYDYELSKTNFHLQVEKDLSKFTYRQYLQNVYNFFDVYKPLFERLCPDTVGVIHQFAYTPVESIKYELPDGDILKVNEARFRGPEVLFKPELIGSEEKSLQEATLNTFKKCDPDLRRGLYQNIVLSGGTTMFQGFVERLYKELKMKLPKGSKIRINAPEERKFSAWIGGSILSSLSSFQSLWVTKEQYNDHGPEIMRRIFF